MRCPDCHRSVPVYPGDENDPFDYCPYCGHREQDDPCFAQTPGGDQCGLEEGHDGPHEVT